MAKFAGLVSYVTQIQKVPGVWTDQVDSRFMKGDIIRQSASSQNESKINSDISLNHRVSLVGDAYAFGNYFNIKYLEMDGKKWRVSSVEIQRPRIIVTLGGLWNER